MTYWSGLLLLETPYPGSKVFRFNAKNGSGGWIWTRQHRIQRQRGLTPVFCPQLVVDVVRLRRKSLFPTQERLIFYVNILRFKLGLRSAFRILPRYRL